MSGALGCRTHPGWLLLKGKTDPASTPPCGSSAARKRTTVTSDTRLVRSRGKLTGGGRRGPPATQGLPRPPGSAGKLTSSANLKFLLLGVHLCEKQGERRLEGGAGGKGMGRGPKKIHGQCLPAPCPRLARARDVRLPCLEKQTVQGLKHPATGCTRCPRGRSTAVPSTDTQSREACGACTRAQQRPPAPSGRQEGRSLLMSQP